MIFETLVKKMREAQKAYFASRTNGRLQESIRLEKMFDAELAKLPVSQIQEPTQTTLL